MTEKENKKLVEFVDTKNISLKGYTLIEGFPDLGLAGTIGARYLVDKLKMDQIGFISSPLFLPIIRIHDGVPMHPVRIYASTQHKLAVVLAEQIIDNRLSHIVAKDLVEWIKKKGITRVISTSGIKLPGGKDVYAFASDNNSKKAIKAAKFEMINDGITSGVTALLMLYLKDNKIDAFCLLGNAKNDADYHAAASLVKAFCKITNVCLDVKPLLAEAKKLEDAIVKHLKTIDTKKETKIGRTPMYT